jgi:hypothetical protein
MTALGFTLEDGDQGRAVDDNQSKAPWSLKPMI